MPRGREGLRHATMLETSTTAIEASKRKDEKTVRIFSRWNLVAPCGHLQCKFFADTLCVNTTLSYT